MSRNLVVRFAGEGGQGQVTAAEGLALAAARVGYHVQTFATYPSQIMGGPTWAQARISPDELLSSGDDLDVLVALNRYAYDHNLDDLREGGVVIYNSEEFELDDIGNSFGLDVDKMARETGNPRAANMIMIGAVGQLASMPQEYFTEFIRDRFTRGRANDQEIIDANIQALGMGYDAVTSSGFSVEQLDQPEQQGSDEAERVLVNGYELLSMGTIAAGLDFFVGYPISPATTTLVFMETNLVGDEQIVVQATSEIESINALVGAGFAGKKAMSSTSGPGLSLMGEGLGLAWMAEIPLVVLNVQRGGPATGLPTKTEQSDLLTALNPGHGDMRLPVIAPGTVEECFWAGVEAMNWAERYQGPVIILSEMSLAERNQDVPHPDLSKVVVERRLVDGGENGDGRYHSSELTPMPLPGGPGAYVANASEHDEQGDTTHLPAVHVQMTERRFNKLKLLECDDYEAEHTEAPVALMPWGGAKGPALAAYRALRERDEEIAWYYTMFLNPLPPALLEELRRKELVLVPELNYLGQFSSVLRGLGVHAESITQYTGLPFKERVLEQLVQERAAPVIGRLATV